MADEIKQQGDLSWDSVYAIAKRLQQEHPAISLETVSLKDIFEWTVALTDFNDDPELANDEILSAIYQDWYEENDPL